MRDFDDILDEVGGFGPFQVVMFVLVSLFETPTAWAMFLQVFVAYDHPWTCSFTHNGSNSSRHGIGFDVGESSTLSYNSTTISLRDFSPSYTNLENCAMLRNDTCGEIFFADGMTTITSEWNLICDLDYAKSLIMTLQMLGVLVGAVVVGQLADLYGRRNIYFIVYALMLVVAFGSSFSQHWQLYAGCRFVIGVFIGGTMVVNFVLPLEMVGRKWRTFCGCIGFWACGVMSLALLGFLIREWRQLTMFCSLLGFPILLSYWFIPESPRWLIQKGRLPEAEKIICRIARWNKRPIPDLTQLAIYMKKEAEHRSLVKGYGFWDLCRNVSLTKNTFIMMYIWFVCSIVYYGTSLNVGHLSGDPYFNFFLLGLVEIPALFLVVVINNRIGRKKTLALLLLVAGLSCFTILFVDLSGKTIELSILTTVLALLGKSGIAGGWAAAQIFAAEIFPTVVRNIGVGMSAMSARVGGIIAPQIVMLSAISKPVPFVIFGVLGVLGATLCVFLPETFNMPLPDTLPQRQCCSCLESDRPTIDDQFLALEITKHLPHMPSEEGGLSTNHSFFTNGQLNNLHNNPDEQTPTDFHRFSTCSTTQIIESTPL